MDICVVYPTTPNVEDSLTHGERNGDAARDGDARDSESPDRAAGPRTDPNLTVFVTSL